MQILIPQFDRVDTDTVKVKGMSYGVGVGWDPARRATFGLWLGWVAHLYSDVGFRCHSER